MPTLPRSSNCKSNEGQRVATNPHTRLLRVGLAEPESREYWRQSQRNLEEGDRVRIAFEERWFGSRAMARVQYLVQTFQMRFDGYPSALKALALWNPLELSDRLAVCHWHLQLSDPIYRKFCATHLVERFNHPEPTLDRNAVLRWAQTQQPSWSLSTVQRLVAGLMGCLNEVGFTEKATAIRPLSLPRVSDLALGYALYSAAGNRVRGDFIPKPLSGLRWAEWRGPGRAPASGAGHHL
jgi:hypothetical protein